MKKAFLVFIVGTAATFFACNSPEKSSEVVKDTVAKKIPSMETAPPKAACDPDPTDTIPGDMYMPQTASPQTADLVRLTLKDKYKADLEKNLIDSFSRQFFFYEVDLNEDSKNEILVGTVGSYFCGSGGCTILLLDNQGNMLGNFTVSDYPVVIDSKKTNGWKDLIIPSGGKNHIMKHTGTKYPSNPSVQPIMKEIPGDDLARALNAFNSPYPRFKF